jgi:hypothetical protein
MSIDNATFKGFLCFCILCFANSAFTQVVSSRGMATLTYEGRFSSEDRDEASRLAKIAALDAYVAEFANPSMSRVFADHRDSLVADVEKFIVSSIELSSDRNSRERTLSVVVRAEINTQLLRAELDGFSSTAATSRNDRSLIALLFMARMQESIQVFEDKEYSRTDTQSSSDASSLVDENIREEEQIASDGIALSSSIQQRESGALSTSETTTTGGSVTKKADKVSFTVTSSQEINSAMTGILSIAGYEVVEAEYVESASGGHLSIERIRNDYSTGADLSPEVLNSTVTGIRTAEIPFLAMGTLDVGLSDTDPVTGNIRVYVTVTGKVLDLQGRFPRTVSSVGPIQFSGLGPNESVARSNALRLASESAAQQIADEMSLRSIR